MSNRGLWWQKSWDSLKFCNTRSSKLENFLPQRRWFHSQKRLENTKDRKHTRKDWWRDGKRWLYLLILVKQFSVLASDLWYWFLLSLSHHSCSNQIIHLMKHPSSKALFSTSYNTVIFPLIKAHKEILIFPLVLIAVSLSVHPDSNQISHHNNCVDRRDFLCIISLIFSDKIIKLFFFTPPDVRIWKRDELKLKNKRKLKAQ